MSVVYLAGKQNISALASWTKHLYKNLCPSWIIISVQQIKICEIGAIESLDCVYCEIDYATLHPTPPLKKKKKKKHTKQIQLVIE